MCVCMSVCVCVCVCGVLPVPSCSAPRSRAVFWTASTTLQSINRKDNGINKDHEEQMLRQEFCRKKHALLLLLTTLNKGEKKKEKKKRSFTYYLISAKTSAMCIHLFFSSFLFLHACTVSTTVAENNTTESLTTGLTKYMCS